MKKIIGWMLLTAPFVTLIVINCAPYGIAEIMVGLAIAISVLLCGFIGANLIMD